jgi:hypothetical protein
MLDKMINNPIYLALPSSFCVTMGKKLFNLITLDRNSTILKAKYNKFILFSNPLLKLCFIS